MTAVWSKIRSADPALLAATCLAAALRLPYIGLYHLVNDEAIVMLAAQRLSLYGQWTWQSLNSTSWRFLPLHSPLTVYLAAIPYLVSPDPRLVRWWVALLAVAAVGLAYWTVRRYFGHTAALYAGLLLAAHVPLVDWSRFSWNTNFAQVFLAAWLLTGLLGYFEAKPRAQTLHWLALSGAFQAHPANAMLAPLSLLQAALGWFRHKPGRPQLVRSTLLGWLLFALSLAPWGIGLAIGGAPTFTAEGVGSAVAQVAQPRRPFDLGELARLYASLIGGVGRRLTPALYNNNGLAAASDAPEYWWPPAAVENVYAAQAAMALAAAVYLIGRGVRRPSETPALVLGLLGVWPMLGIPIAPTHIIQPSYLMAPIYGAVPCLGIALADVSSRSAWLRRLAAGLIGLFVACQAWLTLGTLRTHLLAGVADRFDAPLDTYLSALNAWRDAGAGREIVIFAETMEGKRTPYIQGIYWTVAAAGRSVRVLQAAAPQGMPFPPGGAVYAGTYDGRTIPDWFGEGNTYGVLPNGEPMYRWIVGPASPDASPRLFPENIALFASGARVLGLAYQSEPEAGREWPVTLVWQIEHRPPPGELSFSIRLVDDLGAPMGQVDGSSLAAEAWREGDTVLNRYRLPVSERFAGGPLRLHVLMYGAEAAPAVDGQGAVVAPFVTLAPEGQVDGLGWFEFRAGGRYTPLAGHEYLARLAGAIDLLSFDAPSLEAQPGGAVPIALYWKAARPPALDYRVFVHLRAGDGSLWGQSDKLHPADYPATHWELDRYVLDRHTVILAPDIAPGDYQLYVGLWDEATGQRAPARDEAGQLLGDSARLPAVIRVQP